MKQKGSKTPSKKQVASAVIEQQQHSVSHQSTTQITSGPIPSPDILTGYDQIVPGAAERILQMAENDATHVHSMQASALEAKKIEVKRGQNYGLAIGIAALAVSALAIFLNQPWVAGTIGGTTVVGLVAVFVTGRVAGKKS